MVFWGKMCGVQFLTLIPHASVHKQPLSSFFPNPWVESRGYAPAYTCPVDSLIGVAESLLVSHWSLTKEKRFLMKGSKLDKCLSLSHLVTLKAHWWEGGNAKFCVIILRLSWEYCERWSACLQGRGWLSLKIPLCCRIKILSSTKKPPKCFPVSHPLLDCIEEPASRSDLGDILCTYCHGTLP